MIRLRGVRLCKVRFRDGFRVHCEGQASPDIGEIQVVLPKNLNLRSNSFVGVLII